MFQRWIICTVNFDRKGKVLFNMLERMIVINLHDVGGEESIECATCVITLWRVT